MSEEVIQELNNRIAVCISCDLAQFRQFSVPGSGPTDAPLMIIGEAPGATENRDTQGRPFIGWAGNVLDRILDRAGIARADCFITNMVKCWPGPGNPDPTPHEIEMCSPWLRAQLSLVQPRGIITLGKYSTGLFMPFTNMATVRGTLRQVWWDYDKSCYVMPEYHPSYVGRQVKAKDEPTDEWYADIVKNFVKMKELVW